MAQVYIKNRHAGQQQSQILEICNSKRRERERYGLRENPWRKRGITAGKDKEGNRRRRK
jgi:hypothetical protein